MKERLILDQGNLITKGARKRSGKILKFCDLLTKDEKTENVQEWAWILQTYLLEMKIENVQEWVLKFYNLITRMQWKTNRNGKKFDFNIAWKFLRT